MVRSFFSWCQGRDSNSRRQELHPCALPLSYLGIGTERGIRTHKKTDLSRSRLPITPSRHIEPLGFSGRNGRTRTHTELVLSQLPLPIGLRSLGIHGWIRTNIGQVLNLPPLPIGLHGHGASGEI